MPVYDRYWRLGAALLLLLPAVGAGIVVWYILTGQPLERLFGPGISYSNTCQAVGVVLMLSTAISHILAARKRDRSRRAALRGNLDAMPLSRIAPEQVDVVTAELHTTRGVVSADAAGLHFHRIGTRRHDVSVLWGEARLLEVWHSSVGQQQVRGFSLYGQRAKIEWRLPRSPHARLQKQTDAEAALLAAIHTHTGLAPRTLAPALRAPDVYPVARAGPKPRGIILLIVVVLLPFAAAAATMMLPLTIEPELNAYVALTFGVLGLLLVVASALALSELVTRAPLPDPGAILPPGAPPPDTSGTGIYALRWRERFVTRLGQAALGLLFAGNIVVLLHIMFGAEVAGADAMKFALNFALGAVAVLGVLLLLAAPFTGRSLITADATGLHSGRQTLRWAEVEEVVVRVPSRTVASFKVVGDAGEVTIDWPAKVHATPQRGTQVVTPSELAALVVGRSGKALRVEGD